MTNSSGNEWWQFDNGNSSRRWRFFSSVLLLLFHFIWFLATEKQIVEQPTTTIVTDEMKQVFLFSLLRLPLAESIEQIQFQDARKRQKNKIIKTINKRTAEMVEISFVRGARRRKRNRFDSVVSLIECQKAILLSSSFVRRPTKSYSSRVSFNLHFCRFNSFSVKLRFNSITGNPSNDALRRETKFKKEKTKNLFTKIIIWSFGFVCKVD